MANKFYTIDDVKPATRLLMEMEKRLIDAVSVLKWPAAGKGVRLELESQQDRKIKFWLDLAESSRSTSLIIGLAADRKSKEQVRAGSQQLVRIDLSDKPEILRHMNPDGSVIIGSHIHIDIEGLGIRWAFPLDAQNVVLSNDGEYLVEGMFCGLVDACHITGLPRIEFSLGV